MWEELEIVPEKPFELIVSDGDIKNFILSDSNMKMLVGLFQEVGITHILNYTALTTLSLSFLSFSLISYSLLPSSFPPSLLPPLSHFLLSSFLPSSFLPSSLLPSSLLPSFLSSHPPPSFCYSCDAVGRQGSQVPR